MLVSPPPFGIAALAKLRSNWQDIPAISKTQMLVPLGISSLRPSFATTSTFNFRDLGISVNYDQFQYSSQLSFLTTFPCSNASSSQTPVSQCSCLASLPDIQLPSEFHIFVYQF